MCANFGFGALEASAVEAASLRQDDRRGGRSIAAHLVGKRDGGSVVTADGRSERRGNERDHHEN
jgi:hypothetical protein